MPLSKKRDRERKRFVLKPWKTKLELIAFFGGKCERCGIADPRTLQINHKNGGGTEELRRAGSSTSFYKKVLNGERSTQDLTLLCANCNSIYEYETGRRLCDFQPNPIPNSNPISKTNSNLNSIEQVRKELEKLPPVRPYSKASQIGITKKKQAVS